MIRKSAQPSSNSLKTFFAYGSIVLFFILISLLIKTVFIVQASKFDGKHQFILSIYKSDKIKEIIKFNPQASQIIVRESDGEGIEIIPDAKANTTLDLPLGKNVAETMRWIGFHYNSLSTDLTILDIARLIILSYKLPVELTNKNSLNNFFVDETIAAENKNIQIINASGISGVGKKLETVLSNLGFNIIAVTTSNKEEKLSKIQYFGEETYTLKKLKKLLSLNILKMKKKGIAEIIIIIGRDYKI